MWKNIGSLFLLLTITTAGMAQSGRMPVPTIDGPWWPVASTPDLGEYNSEKQEPVDFGVWQAADGTWQLWSCVRGSKYPGSSYTTRILYGWEGKSLTSPNWEPKGIKWTADQSLGETPGGMQAPFVIKEDQFYYMFYGDWKRICLAKSQDGKDFQRVLGSDGQPDLFTEHSEADFQNNTARDPMVLKQGNTFYCYYTSHLGNPVNEGWAFCRISLNLKDWSESVKVSDTPPYDGNSGKFSDECPQVVYLPEYDLYYLFVTQTYGRNSHTTVYASPSPLYFGIADDSRVVCTLPIAAPEVIFYNGEYYLAALTSELNGIRIAKLKWK